MRIQDIKSHDRPRERLRDLGPRALSDAELLALILRTGSAQENVIDLSHRIIAQVGIDKLASSSLKELEALKGIGPAKASQILALFELAKRAQRDSSSGQALRSPQAVFDLLSPVFKDLDREHFVVLHLNTKYQLVKKETIFVGTLDAAIIHPREIFKAAVRQSACAIILAHNHPSGDPSPSDEDVQITKRLFKIGELMDIQVVDHVIIGKGAWYSFKEDGQI